MILKNLLDPMVHFQPIVKSARNLRGAMLRQRKNNNVTVWYLINDIKEASLYRHTQIPQKGSYDGLSSF